VYGTARLSPRTREFLVTQSGRVGVRAAAQQGGTSRRTVYRWRRRAPDFVDRSSRPHCSPRRAADALEAAVLVLRLDHRLGPDLLGPALGIAPSTAHRILRRHGANRLSHLFPEPPRSFGRYPALAPGELVALDLKRLGRLDRGLGTREARRPEFGHVGYRYLHVAIDMASRLVFVQLRDGYETVHTVAFLKAALSFFDAHRIRVRRVLTDNGSSYWRQFDAACSALQLRHSRTKPYHPWTNGRAEAFIGTIQRECLYATTLWSEDERDLAVALFVAYYNAERPHTALGGSPPLSWLRRRR
jgi:transposase InsO family protein